MKILVADGNEIWLANAKSTLECAGHKVHTKFLGLPTAQEDCEQARKILVRESEVFNPGARILVIGKTLTGGKFTPYVLALLNGSIAHIIACGDRQPFMAALGVIWVPNPLSEIVEIIGEIELADKGLVFETICRELGLPASKVSTGSVPTDIPAV
jgi:hypothetical protein